MVLARVVRAAQVLLVVVALSAVVSLVVRQAPTMAELRRSDGGGAPSGDGSAAIDAGVVYLGACAGCHGERGEGTYAPPLSAKAGGRLASLAPEEVRAVVLDGRGDMPPQRSRLTEAEVEAVVGYVRSLP